MARKVQEINASSTADIAFLLLIFFLVTTTMNVDTGIARVLPAIPEDTQQHNENKIKERNIFVVLINKSDRLLVNGQDMKVSELRAKAKEFIENRHMLEELPEMENKIVLVANPDYVPGGDEPKQIPHKQFQRRYPDGYPVSKGLISLQNDMGTSYRRYMEVQNELVAAYNEVRDELSKKEFGYPYAKLLTKEDMEAIRFAVPMRISEAEPKKIGGK